jgi:hypothetical protein
MAANPQPSLPSSGGIENLVGGYVDYRRAKKAITVSSPNSVADGVPSKFKARKEKAAQKGGFLFCRCRR